MIELKTLYLVSVCVTALLGVLLLLVWSQHRAVRALLWWGGAELALALGLGLLGLRGAIHHIPSIAIANAAIGLAAAMLWIGARVFEGRRVEWVGLFAGPAIWLVACLMPSFYGSINARTGLMALILGVYTWLMAWEFWRKRPDVVRYALVVLLAVHGALFFLRLPAAILAPVQEALPGVGSTWYTVHQFEIVLYKIALVFLLLALTLGRARAPAAAKPKRRRAG